MKSIQYALQDAQRLVDRKLKESSNLEEFPGKKGITMKTNTLSTKPATDFFRFRLSLSEISEKSKTVGMAYLKDGQNIYTLRLWTFLNEKFFLLPSKEDSTKFLIMTREANRGESSKNKYFWNIVGNAKANSDQSAIELSFDLLDKKIYMSIFPEESATPYGQPVPEGLREVA